LEVCAVQKNRIWDSGKTLRLAYVVVVCIPLWLLLGGGSVAVLVVGLGRLWQTQKAGAMIQTGGETSVQAVGQYLIPKLSLG
jgi:hypothetical protein